MSDDVDTITRGADAPSPRTNVPAQRALLVFAGAEPQLVMLPEQASITIGRGASVDVRVDEQSLSRTHARIAFGIHVTLEDLGSSNGTFVGGVRLQPHRVVVITPGSPLQLGNVLLVLHVGATLTPILVGTTDGSNAGADALERAVERIAGTELSVLVAGEPGVGKTTFARRLHDRSARSAGPFVVVGPSTTRHGGSELAQRVASAGGGTLVVEDVAEMDVDAQRTLLDLLDPPPASSTTVLPRLVATTSRELRDTTSAGLLPELGRLFSGVSIVIPPLRTRVHEIARLAQAIAVETAHAAGRAPPVFAPDALALLERQRWPGNVRELAGRISQAVLATGGRVLTATHFADLDDGARRSGALREAREQGEYQQIIETLRTCRGNQTRAAAALGISRSTLLARLEKYGVPRPRKR